MREGLEPAACPLAGSEVRADAGYRAVHHCGPQGAKDSQKIRTLVVGAVFFGCNKE